MLQSFSPAPVADAIGALNLLVLITVRCHGSHLAAGNTAQYRRRFAALFNDASECLIG